MTQAILATDEMHHHVSATLTSGVLGSERRVWDWTKANNTLGYSSISEPRSHREVVGYGS